MNEFENQEVVEQPEVQQDVAPAAESTTEENTTGTEFAAEETVETQVEESESAAETPENFENGAAAEQEEEVAEESQPSEFEVLQQKYDELESNFANLQTAYDQQTASLTELTTVVENLRTSLAAYEKQAEEVENEKKNALIDKYEKLIDAAEIDNVRDNIKNFSYEALESKLAISFANKQINKTEPMVMVPQQEKSSFAILMENYKK